LGFAFAFAVVLRSLGVLVVAVVPLRATLTDGKSVEGDFAGVAESKLQLNVDDETQSLAFDELQSVERLEPDEDATGPTYRVTLAGGSKVAAQDVFVVAENLLIEPRRQAKLSVPLKEVLSIRFRAPAPATDPQWLGLLEQKARGDLLAIRRANDQLDPVPGVIESIAGGVVKFAMDGDTIDAPITKLEGIVLGRTATPSKTTMQVTDHYGSRFSVAKLLPSKADEPLKLQLSDSVTHSVPVEHLSAIFFSGGMQMLAAVEPAQVDYEGYVQTKLSADLQSTWFAPQADGDDLVINGEGMIEYRVEDQFTNLAGAVRRDPSVDKAGDVTVEIFVDDQSVWKEVLTDAQPKGFEVPVDGARRVRFKTDVAADGDLGDKVRITRPRLLK
jgi:hypothetical protein